MTRDIDGKLRDTLHSHASGSVFAVIVGSAASGKTRTAYEAIKMVVPTWRLLLPTTAEELRSTLDSNVPLARTVIWLDELQNYLGPGGLDFATVRRLLIDPDNPVILIGTIWPNFFNEWRSGGQGLVAGWQPGKDSRNVLDLAKRFDLPPHITRAERDRAKFLAATDPRIEEALTQERAGNLTEVLAAQPDLLRYWENPDNVYGAAIVVSAIDARRCGHRDPIPALLLEQLAPHYLTAVQRAKAAPDWFPTAMEWACTSVRGTTAPLNPSAKRMGHVDGYHPSDLLLQQAWDTRDDASIPHEVWRLLVDEPSREQCSRIGVAAWNASQIDLADRAFQRAVATEEEVDALIGLAAMHHNEGNREVARDWARRAAATGHRAGVAVLGFMLDMHGQSEAARAAFLPAAEAGDPDAMYDLGSLLTRQNDLIGAHSWLRRAIEAGSVEAMRDLSGLEDQRGDGQAAQHWLNRAAEEGDVKAMAALSDRLRQKDPEASASWLARAAAAGHPGAATELGSHKLAEGDHEAAQEILRAPAHMGHSFAMLLFGVSYHNQEDYGTALIWFRRAAERLEGAIPFYGKLLADLGHVDEARIWLKRGIDKKQHAAMRYMAELLRKEGKLTEAARLDRRADSVEREEQGGRVSAARGKEKPKKRRNRRTGPQNPATKNDSSSEQPALKNDSASEQGIEPIRLFLSDVP
nr:SEL1-like repeat protein [Streptomyces sp. S1D4-11]QIZ00520.1 sel1 repeat family protein [Streptomyces sp. S1D4-11]